MNTAALQPSPIRALSEGAPAGAIPLGLGEPTWDLPEPARRALAAESGPCGYGPNAGLPELRRTVAARHGATEEEVLITSGSQGALFSLFMAWVEPGTQVLVPDPGFPAYPSLARLAGAEAVPYALEGGRLDAAAFGAALGSHPNVSVAVINLPSNPTGGGASLADLRIVAEACRSRGVLLISDEVYRELHFGTRGPSLREVSPEGVVLGSVSKGWAAPGLRVGWAVGAPAWLAPARMVHAQAVTAASASCQRAALALLENSEAVLARSRQEIAVRWEVLSATWFDCLGEALQPPDGGFYYWAPLPKQALNDPMAFCLQLRDEAKVVLVPGTAFGPAGRPFARLSFAARPEQIVEGIRRLAPHWRLP